MTERGVLFYLLVVGFMSLGYAVFDRSRYGASLALTILASFMFAYSFVLFNGAAPAHWATTAPPWFVSRIVLASAMLIAILGLWRADLRMLLTDRCITALVIIAVSIVPATLLYLTLADTSSIRVSKSVILIFSCILSFTLCLPFALALPLAQRPETRAATRLAIGIAVLMCAVTALLGFVEVAFDIGIVRNMFIMGVVETRASSTFINPNWFAIGLVPFVYLSLLLALNGQHRVGWALSGFSTLGMVVASSRSVVAVLIGSLLVFALCGLLSDRKTRGQIFQALVTLVGGSASGVVVGLIVAFMLGSIAWDRFTTLLLRLVLWPGLISTQSAAFQSVFGRIDVSSLFQSGVGQGNSGAGQGNFAVGAGVVDSAYLFLLVVNPPALVLLVVFFATLLYLAFGRWRQTRSATSSLSVGLLTFVVLVGFIAQVYWAFPVWIALSIMLSWILAELRPKVFLGRTSEP